MTIMEDFAIGGRNDGFVYICTYIQKSSSRSAVISAVLDPEGQAFVLIQVLYKYWALLYQLNRNLIIYLKACFILEEQRRIV